MNASKFFFVLALLAIGGCDNEATTPNVVQNVSYVTNVYANSPAPSASGERVVGADPPVVVVDGPSVGTPSIPACEQFFELTESCARSLTSDAAALSKFEGRVQSARAAASRAEASGDPGLISQAAAQCEAAADAYRVAPCG